MDVRIFRANERMSHTTSTADELVEEGLRLYSRGQLDDALNRWKRALHHSPGLTRAREYIQYVEDNRGALEQTFATSSSPATAAPEPEDVAPPVKVSEVPASTVRRGGAAGANLLDEMSWGTVRGPIQSQDRPPDRLPTERSAAPTPSGLPRLRDEDLTPRVDVTKALLAEGAEAPPLASSPQREAAGQRVLMPRAQVDLASDFDAPEPTTGKLGASTPIEVGRSTPLRTPLAPEPIVGDDPQGFEIAAGAVTPDSMIRRRGRGTEQPVQAEERTNEFDQPDLITSEVLTTLDEARSALSPRSRTPLPPLQSLGASEQGRPVPRSADRPVSSTLPIGADFERKAPARTPTAGAAGADLSGDESGEGMLEGARQLYEQGTFEGSLWLCERILTREPANAAAAQLQQRNQQVLLDQCKQKIADLDQVPIVRIPQQEIIWHKLDHRAGFLLSRVDGVLSYGDILDISGMSNFEAYRILAQLLDQGVIGSSR